MEPIQETTQPSESGTMDNCPTCKSVAVEATKNEEASFAFLLALIPVLTLTFFGQVGLL
ncbi:MAG: hypothetical protein AAB519_00450 [Patescibacteria group bacterium]|mgnify:CR=1